ncbi:hypothetical protein SH601_06650 [Gracilibacillus sp. S3-1-1]|uniref:Uncharacterized protein n=1 Tax=Gracilibacillus pellucidus TaxID=3095368 RepID=A0ACC6M454_9BACI|nr:hypothetical protein [Gracilibacillus sp. S3-1-1]MDX8045665.1 hypothetical protein [Gracilibacillus sp. S3-1-1]
MLIFLGILLMFAGLCGYLLYMRYVPVKGIPCVEMDQSARKEQTTVDIRDYQEADNNKINEAVVIPIPYLKRYFHEIPSKSIHIVASNHMEKNLAIRFLKHKGFEIIGYTLTECKSKQKIKKMV